MWSRREELSFALQRRARLESLRRPGRSLYDDDPCDAEPILITSALHHGEPSDEECPVCASERLCTLNYIFGDQLGQFSGRIKSSDELSELQDQVGEFKVRVVEVCPDCGWNFLIRSYLLGDGKKRRPPRRQQTVEDIYG